MVELGVRPAAGKEMPPDLMAVSTDEDADNDEDLLAEHPPVVEGNESEQG
jgi:hypothetical protein